jgi:hypothetical protein
MWEGPGFPRSGQAPDPGDVHSLPMSTSSGARRVRSVAFAVSAVGLTAGAHVTAGGELPDVPQLLLLAGLVEAVSATFARRPRGPVATAGALLLAQVVLHFALVFATPAHVAHVGDIPSPSMLVTHGLAAVVLAALLSHGERLVARAARVLLPVAVLRPFRALPVSRLVVVVLRDVPLRVVGCLHDISGRGPPHPSLAALT